MQYIIDINWHSREQRWFYRLISKSQSVARRIDQGRFRTRAEAFARAFYMLYYLNDQDRDGRGRESTDPGSPRLLAAGDASRPEP